jgi:hypothetical protein
MFIQLADLNLITSTFQSFVTALAIIIGGIWTYRKYIQNREGLPKAKLEHKITHRIVNEKIMLLDINITIYNIGDSKITIQSWEIILNQILPPISEFLDTINAFEISENEVRSIILWHKLISEIKELGKENRHIIEPNESHQFHKNYIISSEIKTVSLYTYFHNIAIEDHSVGWALNTIYDLYNRTDIKKENLIMN